MTDGFPVDKVAAVADGDGREPCEGRVDHVVVLAHAHNGRVRAEPGQHGVGVQIVPCCADGDGDEAGIAVMGHDYSALALHRGAAGNELVLYRGKVTARTAEGVAEEEGVLRLPFAGDTVTLRLYFEDGGTVHYAYELNGQETLLDGSFPAAKSTWSGAKPALFARNTANRAGGQGRFGAVSFECL